MSNKKKLHRHLLVIYILFFVVLALGFFSNFLPDFLRAYRDANEVRYGDARFYYVSAVVRGGMPTALDGLPANVTLQDAYVNLRVRLDEPMTVQNSFNVMGNSRLCFWLPLLTGAALLAALILMALIINSLRKSVRCERPLWHGNILRTRIIGCLVIVAALSEALSRYILQTEASRVLADTSWHVVGTFPLNYIHVTVGVVFLFMAEVIALGVRLGEEQKLTI